MAAAPIIMPAPPPLPWAAASATVVAFFFSGLRSWTSLMNLRVAGEIDGLGSVGRCDSNPSVAAQVVGLLQSPHFISGGVANLSTSKCCSTSITWVAVVAHLAHAYGMAKVITC